MDQDEEENKKPTQAPQPTPSTLLPSPIASVVSLVTRSSSLYLRLGTFVGSLAIDGARVTTLTGLELSRALIESILIRSGHDVASRSTGELGRSEAESTLERSIATLHRTITSISFAASTGFYFSSAALNGATDLSQQLLNTLDSILGSTDSSRAIASIVTLIRREFQNPATGREGEKVGVADLLVGVCGLALLQRWCRRLVDGENRDEKIEEVIWDVVVLSDGSRADVTGNVASESQGLVRAGSMSFMTAGGDDVVAAIDTARDVKDDSDEDTPEINLKQKIMQSLPADASVSITTSTTTTKMITVEITGAHPPDLSPPPGVEIVEENAHHAGDVDMDGGLPTNERRVGSLIPRYRVVYRTTQSKLRGTNIEAKGPIGDTEMALEDDIDMKDVPPMEVQSPGFIVSPLSSDSEEAPELPRRPSGTMSSEKTRTPSRSEETARGKSAIRPRKSTEHIANQKRSRKPMSASSSVSGSEKPLPKKPSNAKSPPVKQSKSTKPPAKPSEKKSFRSALKKGSATTLSNIWNKDHPALEASTQNKSGQRPPWGAPNAAASSTKPHSPVSPTNLSIVPTREAPRPPQRGNPNYFSSRDLGFPGDVPRSPSRASYYSIHEHRRDSIVSQTDTYSIHSADTRPGSPTAFRTHLRAQSNLLRAKSEKNIVSSHLPTGQQSTSNHRRSKSFVPSIYTLNTNNSNTSLVLATHPGRSAFADSETLESLARTGSVGGMFPQHHIVRNITRFVRFASASYGASFLRVMGIMSSAAATTKEIDTIHHHEHHSFSRHTQLPADTILLSSFVDPQGGTDSSGNTNTGVPMVHFISLDHDSKAVVLSCRGTLGFEDVLADMTCDYDNLSWRGNDYSVHKGIHASARRLLDGNGSRVVATIAAALEEFPDYGLVMCGHSLGGGVTALLAIMLSEPSPDSSSTAFVTSSTYPSQQLLLTESNTRGTAPSTIRLPPNRPIHVFAYGPPATLSPALRLATRGLVTTIVNSQDIVPHLSLGVLHDLQAVALAFKTDDSGASNEFRSRVWAGITGAFKEKWYGSEPAGSGLGSEEDDAWAYASLKTLRAAMLSPKLVAPGEVFVVETSPVLKRDAFVKGEGLGKPAVRAVLRYVRDVERRFGTAALRFGGSMLLDHSPGRYEAALGALGRGVLNN